MDTEMPWKAEASITWKVYDSTGLKGMNMDTVFHSKVVTFF